MSNSFYNASGTPGTASFAASAPIRSEYTAIAAGFDKLPTLSAGTASKAVIINPGGTAITTTTGTLALAGNFATTGAFATTLVAGADVSLTLPVVSGTLATLAGAETLSNKTFGTNNNMGTPTALVGTNISGTAAGLTAGNATTAVFATSAGTVTTNANLTGVITSVGNATSIASQTGTGTKFVVDTNPTLIGPTLGAATATSINKVALTAPAGSATLTIADGKTLTANASLTLAGTDGKTLTVSNNITFTATDGSSVAFGTGGTIAAVAYSGSAADLGSGTLPNGRLSGSYTGITGTGALAAGSLAAGFTAVTVPLGGSGRASTTAYAVICGGTTSTAAEQSVASVGTAGQVLTSNGASALPTFQNLGGSTFTQVATNTVSGTPSSVVFTSLNSEDIVIYFSNLAATAGTPGLYIAFSTDGGVTYSSSFQEIGNLSATGEYGCILVIGLKLGRTSIFGTSSGLTTSPPAATPVMIGQAGCSIGTMISSAPITTIKVLPAASTFVDGGVITLYGRS